MKNSVRSGLRRCAPAAALLLGVGAWVLFGGGTAPVRAAVDSFLRFDGVPGESKDAAHMNWIEITSVSAGDLNGDAKADREASQASTSALMVRKAGGDPKSANIGSQSTGAGAGKVSMTHDSATGQASGKRQHKPLVIMKVMDKSSPMLSQACASGKHFSSAELDIRGQHYMLHDVMITSVQKSGSGERPMESISLSYERIEMK